MICQPSITKQSTFFPASPSLPLLRQKINDTHLVQVTWIHLSTHIMRVVTMYSISIVIGLPIPQDVPETFKFDSKHVHVSLKLLPLTNFVNILPNPFTKWWTCFSNCVIFIKCDIMSITVWAHIVSYPMIIFNSKHQTMTILHAPFIEYRLFLLFTGCCCF